MALGQAGSAAVGLVSVRLLTGLVGPEEYGTLALALTLGVLSNQTAFGPLSAGLMRLYPSTHKRGIVGSLLETRRNLLVQGGLVFLVPASIGSLVSLIVGAEQISALLMLACLVALAGGVETTAVSLQSAARRRGWAALSGVTGPALRYGFGVLFAVVLVPSAVTVLLGYCFGAACVAMLQRCQIRRLFGTLTARPSDSSDLQRELVRYTWPFSVWGLFFWLQLASDRWALAFFRDSHEVGLYAALFQIGYYPVMQVMTVLGGFIQPIIFARAQSVDNRSAHRASIAAAACAAGLTLLGTICAAAFSGRIIGVVLDERYVDIGSLLPWVVLAAGLFSVGQMFNNIALTEFASKTLLWPSLFTSLFGVSLTFLLARQWGIAGVVSANVAYSLLFLVWTGKRAREASRVS